VATYFAARESVRPFSGSIRVEQSGHTLFNHSFGYADIEQEAPNSNDTIYRIGSLTKPIVAAAALNLIAAGKLTASDPICRYLADARSDGSL
jgi:CubicO group peptidase (beta-lactamase class C family)